MKQNLIKIQNEFPDTHFLLYKSKQYPIKFDYFKLASQYFKKNKDVLELNSIINIEEAEGQLKLQETTIQTFIKYVQHQEINLNDENALELHYLSNRFEVEQLKKSTKEYIESHQQELSIQIILQNQNDQTFNGDIYEDIISSNFDEFIKDERIQDLKIPILYRIMSKYAESTKNQSKIGQDQINEFLMSMISKRGRESSVLLQFARFDKCSKNILKRLLKEYSNVIDLNYINSMIVELYLRSEEEKEMKEIEYQSKFDELTKSTQKKISQILEANEKVNLELTQKLKEEKELHSKEIQNLKAKEKQNEKIIDQLRSQNIEYEKNDRKQKEMLSMLTKEKEDLNNQLEMDRKKKEENIISIPYQDGNEFSGIIDYLTRKTGGNIHDNGTIEVTSNSINNSSYHPKNLLDHDENIYYDAKTGDKFPTVTFDFKNMEIKIDKYSIKSGNWQENYGHMKNWVIEISNDSKEWKTIDSHSNSSELNGRLITRTFNATQQQFSRYCRYRHTGDYWITNNIQIGFLNIEFFGHLKIPNE